MIRITVRPIWLSKDDPEQAVMKHLSTIVTEPGESAGSEYPIRPLLSGGGNQAVVDFWVIESSFTWRARLTGGILEVRCRRKMEPSLVELIQQTFG